MNERTSRKPVWLTFETGIVFILLFLAQIVGLTFLFEYEFAKTVIPASKIEHIRTNELYRYLYSVFVSASLTLMLVMFYKSREDSDAIKSSMNRIEETFRDTSKVASKNSNKNWRFGMQEALEDTFGRNNGEKTHRIFLVVNRILFIPTEIFEDLRQILGSEDGPELAILLTSSSRERNSSTATEIRKTLLKGVRSKKARSEILTKVLIYEVSYAKGIELVVFQDHIFSSFSHSRITRNRSYLHIKDRETARSVKLSLAETMKTNTSAI